MKKGWILPAVFLVILISIGVFIYTKYSKYPNDKTVTTAATIPKYQNSTGWNLKEVRNLCFLAIDECIQPVVIKFEAKDGWPAVYTFYINSLVSDKWQTNSRVVTSVPTGVVFTKDDCTTTISPKKPNFLGGDSSGVLKQITITVVCK